jgi:methylmalonyl-CoA/ethylmalonyl-CoA epimerase
VTFRFHHCGLAVSSIEKALPGIMHVSGCSEPPVIYEDPIQRVRVAFVGELELVEPCGEDSPVAEVVRKGGGLYHVCYEVDNLESAIERARAERCLLISEPQPAVAFAGRRIAFLMTPKYLLVEYVEAA